MHTHTPTPLLPNTSSSARPRLLSPLRCYSCESNVGYIDFIGVLIPPMEFSASKVSSIAFVAERKVTCRSHGIVSSLAKSLWQKNNPSIDLQRLSRTHLLRVKVGFSGEGLRVLRGKPNLIIPWKSPTVCLSTRTQRTEEKECSNLPSAQIGEEDKHPIMPGKILHSRLGLAEACRYVHNDAKYVNERARNDIILLSRGIMQLDARARKDVAILGSEFLKLDARVREDTGKIDRDVKEKAARLHHIATIIKDRAQSRLKSAADKHWSDGALNADLRLADFRAKQRAMEDSLMALEFIKNIHDLMVSKMYKLPLHRENGSLLGNDMLEGLMLEKNGRTSEFFPGVVSADRINAIQEAYCSMASALSEADGIDYTDPEELELLIATLIDLDAMDGKSSVSLLAECSSSPDVNTRKALANALAAAPSMWTLGNAGMGALQRLSEDTNPAIAAAASRAIYELKKQWEIEEGDSWRFMMNQTPAKEVDNQEDRNDPNTK